MSAKDGTRIFADERGLWRQQPPSRVPFGIEWNEIERIVGYKLDLIDAEEIVLEVDFENGHFMQFNENEDGFSSIAAAISSTLVGIDADWFEQVRNLSITNQPLLEIWRRVAGE